MTDWLSPADVGAWLAENGAMYERDVHGQRKALEQFVRSLAAVDTTLWAHSTFPVDVARLLVKAMDGGEPGEKPTHPETGEVPRNSGSSYGGGAK